MTRNKLTGLLLCVCCTAHAQGERWDTYMAQLGGKPASVLVDMDAVKEAPDNLLPYLVVTGPRSVRCPGKSGIPDTSEIAKMESVLDLTSAFLSGVTARKLVGTLTYNCERLNYYYVRDTTAVRNALMRMYRNNFPAYEYTVKVKPEPQWVTYRAFLYPDSTAQSWMRNNRVMTQMLLSGDDLLSPRDIIHTIYFKTDTGRTAFANTVKTKGYSIDKQYDAPTTALPYELTVKRTGRVIMDSIMRMESELTAAAKEHDGYYKQWDAPQR